jgi:hypothetical protein
VNRGVALLLAIIGGAAIALALLMAGTAVVAGALWIFVFGDDPWPGWVQTVLNIVIPLVGFVLWAMFGRAIWFQLKRN